MTTSFNKQKHEYLIDGKPATGVTTVISVLAKPALIGWAANEAVKYIKDNVDSFYQKSGTDCYVIYPSTLEEARTAHTRKKEAAGTHGTDAHALVEEYIGLNLKNNEGKPFIEYHWQTEDSWLRPILPFMKWANENVDHFLFAERIMYDAKRFIAGTCDFAYIDKQGRRVISDFKTSGSGIYYEMWIQTAAYQMLAEGEGDEKYDYRTIVRLDKKGKFEVQERHDYKTDVTAFLCALKLYRAMGTYKKV